MQKQSDMRQNPVIKSVLDIKGIGLIYLGVIGIILGVFATVSAVATCL